MTFPINGSAFSRFGDSRVLIRLLAAGMAMFFAGAAMAQSVTIGDFVFNDANANGQQDGGETGLAGVTVTLFLPGFGPDGIAGNADDAAAVATQTTPESGAYSFSGLPPGTYQVNFGTLSGYSRTIADNGADATDSDANAGTGTTSTFTLAADTTNNTIDAGYYAPVPVTIALSNLTRTYTGSPRTCTVTTNPAGVARTVTYAGSTTPPTNAGSYAVVATANPPYVGTASGTFVIAKASITLDPLPAKTYGDAPLTVTPTVSSGLPITWQSSDPAVATIHSTSGLVTIVGAGQTSIIATDPGNANYNATWTAQPLNVARSAAPLPSGTQAVTYTGSAQGLIPATLPSGQATEITYRDTAVPEATATPVVVFQNGPDTLPSVGSTGLSTSKYWGMAKYAGLAGTARKLHSCDVTLSSFASYEASGPEPYYTWATNPINSHLVQPPPAVSVPGNSGFYRHPITLAFYAYTDAPGGGGFERYRLLTSKTVTAEIPWRPVKEANGITPYGSQSYAFRVSFPFPDGVILPQQVWVAVSFNTNNYGTAPVGVAGPYDRLNVTNASGQQMGTTDLNFALIFKDWRWQTASGTVGPMLRLYAVPTNATPTAPVNAGSYEVKTKTAYFGDDGTSTSALMINKAPLAINLSNLTQVRNGNDPKPVTVSTTPTAIATSVTYAGSSTAPFALGSYPVNATSANPNYEGEANATLRIGDNYTSWRNATFATSGLPPEQITDIADPDGDGLNNFLEYASNLNPLLGDQPSPTGLAQGVGTVAFTYRKYLHALDLNYSILQSTQLADSLSWAPVAPVSESTLSDDGATRIIQATVEKPANQPSCFLRLKVTP